jgi:hypothetical protein
MAASGADSAAETAARPPNRFATIGERLGTAMLRRLFVVGLLSLLVTVGLFLANVSREWAIYYWSVMFPIFGLVCLGHEIVSAPDEQMFSWRMLTRQALHWLVPIIAVKIVFLQLERGMLDAPAASLTIVLLLALTSFLAGIHFDHVFLWISLFLAFAAVVGTEIQAYIWMIAAVAIVAIIVGVALALLMHKRGGGSQLVHPEAGAGS